MKMKNVPFIIFIGNPYQSAQVGWLVRNDKIHCIILKKSGAVKCLQFLYLLFAPEML